MALPFAHVTPYMALLYAIAACAYKLIGACMPRCAWRGCVAAFGDAAPSWRQRIGGACGGGDQRRGGSRHRRRRSNALLRNGVTGDAATRRGGGVGGGGGVRRITARLRGVAVYHRGG